MPTPEQEKNKQEVQKQPESPEAKAQAAGAVLQQKRERQAADILIGAERETTPQETEKNPDQQAQEIAEKYTRGIPEADRQLDPKQTEFAIQLLQRTQQSRDDLFSTRDKFGNLPRDIKETLDRGENGLAIDRINDFATTPSLGYVEADKLQAILAGPLPKKVRGAVVDMIMRGGDHSPSGLFKDFAKKLQGAKPEENAGLLAQMVQEAGDDAYRNADAVRQKAVYELLVGLYPALVNDPRLKEGRIETPAVTPGSETKEMQQERKEIALRDVNFIHIEDDPLTLKNMQKDLASQLDMKNRLGSSRSVEGAKKILQQLAEGGKPLHLVILDKSFMQREADKFDHGGAWQFFMGELEKIAPANEKLKDVRVVIASGDIDDATLREMQQRFPRIIGALQKGEEGLPLRLAAILGKDGMVTKEGKVAEAMQREQGK